MMLIYVTVFDILSAPNTPEFEYFLPLCVP